MDGVDFLLEAAPPAFRPDLPPSPHGDKILNAIKNPKVGAAATKTLQEVFTAYKRWRESTLTASSLEDAVDALNEYSVRVISEMARSASSRDRGQLKVESSLVEETLPLLVSRFAPLPESLEHGPANCVVKASFKVSRQGCSFRVGATKNIDYAVYAPAQVVVSHTPDFKGAEWVKANLPLVAVECKTNLDKVMFQEVRATAAEIRSTVPTSATLLVFQWKDMKWADGGLLEVIPLRGGGATRREFRAEERRGGLVGFLENHPFQASAFEQVLGVVESTLEGSLRETW